MPALLLTGPAVEPPAVAPNPDFDQRSPSPFTDQLRRAASVAPLANLPEVAKTLWAGLASGRITEADAEAVSGLIEERRTRHRDIEGQHQIPARAASEAPGRPTALPPRVWSYFPRKRPQRSPNREQSLERRRTLAACSPLPPALAAKFTTGELSVLWIVSEEVAARGSCSLSLPELAARAGVGLTKARLALKIAQDLGLLTVQERRVPYKPNLPNLIRLSSAEWKTWIGRRKARKPPIITLATPYRPATAEPSIIIGSTSEKPTESKGFRE